MMNYLVVSQQKDESSTPVESSTSSLSMMSNSSTCSEVTSTTTLSGDQTKLTSTTEIKEVHTTTTIITTTTTTTTLNDATGQDANSQAPAQNHATPLTTPSGDGNIRTDTAEDKGKPKIVIQSLIPGMKGATLQMDGKDGGALAKAASSGTKTVLVVNRDGGKVMLQVASQPMEKMGDDKTNDPNSPLLPGQGESFD